MLKKLSVNVTDDLIAKVDALVEQHGPFARRHSIHLAALRIGLAELEADPDRINEAVGPHLEQQA
jgi:hypothetical protein